MTKRLSAKSAFRRVQKGKKLPSEYIISENKTFFAGTYTADQAAENVALWLDVVNGASVPPAKNLFSFKISDTLAKISASSEVIINYTVDAGGYILTNDSDQDFINPSNRDILVLAGSSNVSDFKVRFTTGISVAVYIQTSELLSSSIVSYVLRDTLENLSQVPQVIAGSASYTISDASGQLVGLNSEKWSIVQGASNAADYPQTFVLAPQTGSVNEGSTANFVLTSVNGVPGTVYQYTIGGTVTAGDIVGGLLTGSVILDAGGSAGIAIELVADGVSEVVENLILTIAGTSAAFNVNDSSVGYTLEQALLFGAGNFPPAGITSYAIAPVQFNPGSVTVVVAQEVYAQVQSIIAGALNSSSLVLSNVFAWSINDTASNILAAKVTPEVTGATLVSLLNPAVGITVADASQLVALPNFDDQYTLLDTLSNLSAAPSSLVNGASSYELTNTAGQLPDLTQARWELAQGASNAADYPQTFILIPNTNEVNEGDTVFFSLSSVNGVPGSAYDYEITGVLAEDVLGGDLDGRVTLLANGGALIAVTLVADSLTEGDEILTVTVVGAATASTTVIDTSVDQARNFTTNIDDLNGTSLADNLFVGSVSENFLLTGIQTTYQPGDQVDGDGGNNTLRLFMSPGSVADGVTVSNIQNLDLRLTSGLDIPNIGLLTQVVMTDWDDSLEQINILSNKSDVAFVEQKTIADVNIRDLSTLDDQSTYIFNYAAGVLDGADDRLLLSVNNVNGEDAADVVIDDGMEAIGIEVLDRNGDRYASNIDFEALGLSEIDVTGGRDGQSFTLNAIVEDGADFDSTGFVGDMNLTSDNIRTARLGGGNDDVTVTGQADRSDSSYNLGEGDNSFSYTGTLGGDVFAGDDDDDVSVGATASTSTIDVGDGFNIVDVSGNHAGTILGGMGTEIVEVGSTSAGSLIDVDGGDNAVDVSGNHAGTIIAGDGENEVEVGSTAAATVLAPISQIILGNGNNSVNVASTHAGAITAGNGSNGVVVIGSTTAAVGVSPASSITLGDGGNFVFIDETHAGELTTGTGNDTVVVGTLSDDGLVTGDISTGDGTDSITVFGNVVNASIDLGEGDNNLLIILGDLTAGSPGTITFGNGNNNELFVQESINGELVQFGAGDSALITVGNDVNGATINVLGTSTELFIGDGVLNGAAITLGDGTNSVDIGDDISGGSTITTGDGVDQWTLGALQTALFKPLSTPTVGSTVGTATVLNTGAGDDQFTVFVNDSTYHTVVSSGGFINGSDGEGDTFTVVASTNTEVIARTQTQQVTVNLLSLDPNSYAIGQELTLTFSRGAQTFTVDYFVKSTDIVQGNGAQTSQRVAAGLRDAVNTQQGALFTAAAPTTGAFTITSVAPIEDYQITSNQGTVTVNRISDARITNFEAVELVALNNESAATDTVINADFALINGAETILLDSQVQTVASQQNLGWSGTYTSYGQSGPTTFELENLPGGQEITARGYETSATGNQEVYRIAVGDTVATGSGDSTGDHEVGDIIRITIGTQVLEYTVSEADLSDGVNGIADAVNIANGIAALIESETGLTAIVDNRSTSPVVTDPTAVYVTILGAAGVDYGPVIVDQIREVSEEVLDLSGTNWNLEEFQPEYDEISGYQVDDVITIVIDNVTYEYIIQPSDLASDCERVVYETLSENLAALIGPPAAAHWGILNFGVEADVTVTRMVNGLDIQNTFVVEPNPLQQATPVDDGITDVIIAAQLAADATNTTMDLTVDGYGAFDISISPDLDSGYTDLDLTLADTFSHTINTNGANASGNPLNFTDSIVVVDQTGLITAGITITLDNVLAPVVNTAGSAANFIIDQAAVRQAYYAANPTGTYFNTDVINITTGDGDDHLIAWAPSLLLPGSQIDLGGGINSLTLVWRDGDITSADLEAIANIDFSGSLFQLSIANDLLLTQPLTTFTLPTTGVELLSFSDVDAVELDPSGNPFNLNEIARDFTIQGAANSFSITSSGDFELGAAGEDGIAGTLTVEVDSSGNEADGALNVDASDNILFAIGNQNLEAVSVDAGGDAEVQISDNSGAEFSIGNVLISSSRDDTTFSVRDNVASLVELGNVSLFADDKGFINFEDNDDTQILTLDISLVSVDDDADVNVRRNFDSRVEIGSISIQAEDDADLRIVDNEDTDILVGDISLFSCTEDADVRVNGNILTGLNSDPDDVDFDMTITLGSISVEAGPGDDAEVRFEDNEDQTDDADLVISSGDINIVSYDDAELHIDDNIAITLDIGFVTMKGGDDAWFHVARNVGAVYFGVDSGLQIVVDSVDVTSITTDNVTLSAGTLEGDSSARFEIEGNSLLVASFGSDNELFAPLAGNGLADVSLISEDIAYIDISGNTVFRIDMGSVDVIAESRASFEIQANSRDSVYTIDPSLNLLITEAFVDEYSAVGIFTGDVRVISQDVSGNSSLDAYFDISGNLGIVVETDSVHVEAQASDDDARFQMFNNVDTDVTTGSMSITAGEDAAFLANFNGEDSSLDIQDLTVFAENGDAEFDVSGNSGFDLSIGQNPPIAADDEPSVQLTAAGDVDFSIFSNIFGSVQTSDILMEAGDDVNFLIVNNTLQQVFIGNTDIDAASDGNNGDAFFGILGNFASDIRVGASLDPSGNTVVEPRGTITIDAESVGFYGVDPSNNSFTGIEPGEDGVWGFDVFGNIFTGVLLGDIAITAAANDVFGPLDEGDVTVRLATGEDSVIDAGDFTVLADRDIYFLADNFDGSVNSVLNLGDIALTSGLDTSLDASGNFIRPNLSSDLFFRGVDFGGNSTNDDVQTITLDANSRGSGVGNVYALIDTAPDLVELVVEGTNAEIYLEGVIGPNAPTPPRVSAFTLDLTGLTGSFSDIETYTPLGNDAAANRLQDDGVYVVTTDATFAQGLRDVEIRIGSSDFVYNAQYSEFIDTDLNLSYYGLNSTEDWFNDEGWFSLGVSVANYLVPTVAEQTFSINGVSGDPTDGSADYEAALSYIFQAGDREFAAVINYLWVDSAAEWFYSGSDGVDWYELIGPSYAERTQEFVEVAIGANISISFGNGSGTTTIAPTQVTFTGLADGSGFDYILSAQRGFGDGGDRLDEALTGLATSAVFDTVPGVFANDGVGNLASEVFVFTDKDMGEIVIGGFNTRLDTAIPGVLGTLRGEGLVDYLDFSELGVTANNLTYTWDNADGYFADLLITFENYSDITGSVRLVGAGEYQPLNGLPDANYLFAVQNSIIV